MTQLPRDVQTGSFMGYPRNYVKFWYPSEEIACMEIGKTNKLHTRSQRVTTTLTRSVSCHGSLTSLTTISRSVARFATHSKNHTKFICRIYFRYQSTGKFLCSFVSWDLEKKMISRWSISNPAIFSIISKRMAKGFCVTRNGPFCWVTRDCTQIAGFQFPAIQNRSK